MRHHFIPALLSGLFLVLTHGSALAVEPQIVGSPRYTAQVLKALDLLKTRDAAAYSIVTNYVGRIKESAHSGMWAYNNPPTYEMSDVTAYYSLTWCTATIAHDSFHSKLFHEYEKAHRGPVPDSVWTGVGAEQQCMKHQIDVMKNIGAPSAEISYAEQQADGHYVKSNQGRLGSWLSYLNRSW